MRDDLGKWEAQGVSVALIGSGNATFAEAFREVFALDSRVLIDPDRVAYRAAGLRRVLHDEFSEPYGLEILPELDVFADDFAATESGVAEVVIPPGSSVIGQSPMELRLRQTHGLSILCIHRGEETMSHVETEDHVATHIGVVPLQAGD